MIMNPAAGFGVYFFQPPSYPQEVVNTRISKRARNLRAGAVTKLSKEEFLVLYKNVPGTSWKCTCMSSFT